MAEMAEIAREEAGRDHGLVRAIGVFGFAAAITNEVVGSGVYRIPGGMAAAAGTMAPYAYLACLVAMGAIVLCFAEAGSRVPTSGGPYGYVEAAFGPMLGFIAGMLVWLSSVLACGGIAAAVADTIGVMVPALTGIVPHSLLIFAVLGAMAWINLLGVDLAARVIGLATLVKLLPLLFFLVVGGIALATGSHAAAPVTNTPDVGVGIGRAATLAIFALSGMETPLAASGEVTNPSRNVPRALLLAMGSIGLLYIAIQLIADGLLGAGLIGSKTPLADALGTLDVRLRAPLLFGAFLSMLFWLGSDLLGAPRVLFAFARDGLLPAPLGRLHPKWRTPYWAILLHAGLASLLALSGTYEALAVLSAQAIAPLYALVCAAAIVLQRRGVAILGKPLSLPLLPVAALVGIVSMGALLAVAEPAEIGAVAGVVVGSALLFLVMRKRR